MQHYFGTPVKPGLLAQIRAECDLVVTAVEDCGSCSAATVADGILFERAGVPAVSIVSDSPDVLKSGGGRVTSTVLTPHDHEVSLED